MPSAILSILLFLTVSAHGDECLVYDTDGTSASQNHDVKKYSTEFLSCFLDGAKVFSLRNFELDGEAVRLVVEPASLRTAIVKNSCLVQCADTNAADYEATLYGATLDDSIGAPYPLQNDGLIKGNANKKFVAVTVDMCPSTKGISQNVYDKLVKVAEDQGAAVPVGVAMTKKWLEKYPEHFKWIKQQQRDGVLDILWINHSATHPYKQNVALENNFLLSSGVNFTNEVIGTEAALVKAGVTPSVFFRFPGLVSSEALILKLGDWGLIPLGSKAWLAKGEEAGANSIILIHGNKNEPAGEKLFLDYVQTKSADIAWGSLLNLLGV